MQSHFYFNRVFIRVRIQVDFVDSSYERNVICICFGNVYNVTFDGETLKPRENGTKDKSSIPGYEFVRTEEDSNGNVRHVYRQVVHSESKVEIPTTVQEHKNELPNTGTGDEFTIFGAAAASILAGLGIAIPGKKKED